METFKQVKAQTVSQGTETTSEAERLAELSERVNLNILCGMPARNKYPAFRDDLTIDQVRDATMLLHQARRAQDKERARALRYEAEKIIYPHQEHEAGRGGLKMLELVFQNDVEA